MKRVLSALRRGKVLVLALLVALTLGTASAALAGSGVGGVFNLGKTNTVNAITTLVGSVSGPSQRIDNNSTNSAATALDLQVEPGKTPMKVNSTTKVAKLNADRLDDKSAEDLSRVAVMNTATTTELPADGISEVTYGDPLSITAPAAGFVRINGNVTVRNSGCSSGCEFQAFARHINSGSVSIPQEDEALSARGNAGLDAVFPVSAGVNTFDIRLRRFSGNGELDGWWGVLTAEYTPYGSTGGGTLNASGLRDTSQAPINKQPPTR